MYHIGQIQSVSDRFRSNGVRSNSVGLGPTSLDNIDQIRTNFPLRHTHTLMCARRVARMLSLSSIKASQAGLMSPALSRNMRVSTSASFLFTERSESVWTLRWGVGKLGPEFERGGWPQG